MENGSIQKEFRIDIPKPRNDSIRYQATFNKLCSDVRKSMRASNAQQDLGGIQN